MHMLHVESRSIDGTVEAVDLDQTPADIVALSFTDADLGVLAAAWDGDRAHLPSLRLANLTALRHPYSVDLYIEKVASKAKFILVRLLGGSDYWRYGVDELARLARSSGVQLAIVPGDHRPDPRLDEASSVSGEDLRQIWTYFASGGVENISACLRFIAGQLAPGTPVPLPKSLPSLGLLTAACRSGEPTAPLALIILYRAWVLAADTAPVTALADALNARGFRVDAVFVTSLKDPDAVTPLGAMLGDNPPQIILNLTAFSARLDDGGTVLDRADVPVLQLMLSGGGRPQWLKSNRGLGPADIAMNVVLPEFDGRLSAGAISFKGEMPRDAALEFTRLVHEPDEDGIAYAADLAAAWAALGRAPRAERRIACILSDYPAKAGRTGYAVGLDTPASIIAIAERLAREGYRCAGLTDAAALAQALSSGSTTATLDLGTYEALLAALPADFVKQLKAVWGDPNDDLSLIDGAFSFRFVRAGRLIVAVQPDRGTVAARKTEYHDVLRPPRHGYVAFYLWLRHVERVHAVLHCGTHGTLEWLPGKAVALSAGCSPRVILGPLPLIYPFIVNNPGEAAQAKRRTAAVTIGHLTPPLTAAGTHGAAVELEGLFEEYAEAQTLDPRRAIRLAEVIIARAHETGLAAESGVAPGTDAADALVKLDTWLCDLKDMRIGDGLHVFGQAPDTGRRIETARTLAAVSGQDDTAAIERLIDRCAEAEMVGLLKALDGRFVPPGPAGAPARGRTDVMPTGRNLYSIDPRSVPTRTAWEIGRLTADEMATRHAQEHGDWPRRVVLDIWGSATMRTGGDDLAQALALLGVCPRWDGGSNRVSGFDILPMAVMNRPRIDVTLRISGLFRDVFPAQIALFNQVVQEVARLDESPEDNPLAASVRAASGDTGQRVFGAAPGQYGIGLSRIVGAGDWESRHMLGEAYLQATSHAYGIDSEALPAASAFRARVANADAFMHVQDLPDQDVLDADAFAEHEGGFAAAAALLGAAPALYHADTTRPGITKIRTVREEVARVLRGRAANPRWISGQMRHGFRGAAEIAETVDNFMAYAALTDVTESYQFDLLFDATLGNEEVASFLSAANPAAAQAIADRFDEAVRRGFWTSRRNSTASILAKLRTAAE